MRQRLALAAACLPAGALSRAAVAPRTFDLLSMLGDILLAPLPYSPDRLTPPGLLAPQSTAVPAPVVDLGYAQYAGYFDATLDMNVYRGIRYAARPERWALPQPPQANRTRVFPALANPPRCPQFPLAPQLDDYDFARDVLGDEDCLFLNVFAPADARDLPVLFWIHGGGYGQGAASQFDWSFLARTAANGFVAVVVQYRLGAFGFAASGALARRGGVPNAGLRDVRLALQWTRDHAARFGGDPDQVVVAGESAGGGAAMLMAMANGGREGTALFRRVVASSPYLPTQPNFDDALPNEYYRQFAERAGCLRKTPSRFASRDDDAVLQCLRKTDSVVLQKAAAETTLGAKYGQWAFMPVTDGVLIQQRPTAQLLAGQVNGESVLTSNNANEGFWFVPQNITTAADFTAFVQRIYPALTPANMESILALYAINTTLGAGPDLVVGPRRPGFATSGLAPPYATNMSSAASGWQQAANNLYAETTFICPSYWLADAYRAPPPSPTQSLMALVGGLVPRTLAVATTTKTAWRYQFSVADALHGSDINPLEADPSAAAAAGGGGAGAAHMDSGFRRAMQSVWGGFIVGGQPGLGEEMVAAVARQGGNVSAAAAGGSWAPWGKGSAMLNMNVTEGPPSVAVADWAVVDGASWEGGRTARCALWAELGSVMQQ